MLFGLVREMDTERLGERAEKARLWPKHLSGRRLSPRALQGAEGQSTRTAVRLLRNWGRRACVFFRSPEKGLPGRDKTQKSYSGFILQQGEPGGSRLRIRGVLYELGGKGGEGVGRNHICVENAGSPQGPESALRGPRPHRQKKIPKKWRGKTDDDKLFLSRGGKAKKSASPGQNSDAKALRWGNTKPQARTRHWREGKIPKVESEEGGKFADRRETTGS